MRHSDLALFVRSCLLLFSAQSADSIVLAELAPCTRAVWVVVLVHFELDCGFRELTIRRRRRVRGEDSYASSAWLQLTSPAGSKNVHELHYTHESRPSKYHTSDSYTNPVHVVYTETLQA